MELKFIPKSALEVFGEKIFFLLVENFSETYFVGGMVRDILLGKKVNDIDITTKAVPKQVVKLLQNSGIKFSDHNSEYGIITATREELSVEIATFRQDIYRKNRYPKVRYEESAEIDSQRRDFTINALYFSLNTGKIYDYNNGINDIRDRILRFIGDPELRIKEDALRSLRALRFAGDLNLKIESKSADVIKQRQDLVKKLTASRIEKEILKCKFTKTKNLIKKFLCDPKALDKFIFFS